MRHWSIGLALFLTLTLFGFSGSARAEAIRLDSTLCHAVTQAGNAEPRAFDCSGVEPKGYSHATLWLHGRIDGARAGQAVALLVHQSRFASLAVTFDYADGYRLPVGTVAPGNFGETLRLGGQIAFEAPARAAPVRAVTMRIERLADIEFLRVRALDRDEAGRATSMLGALVGAALTLLAIGALYSVSLAVASRQAFLAWHAGWALSVLAWGAIWSQFAAMQWPALAGSLASQICTALATFACLCATVCAMAPIGDAYLPRAVRRAIIAVGVGTAGVGLWAATIVDERLAAVGSVLGILTLANLLTVFVAVGIAWRRGSQEARDFALAWTPPMIAVGVTQCIDLDTLLYGGGPQLMVLIACALQTAWLAIATTMRLARLRVERDMARERQRELDELVRRDPLTGLLNRRGLMAAAAELQASPAGLCLLLIDLDHFKSINDRFGHDIGDEVLRGIGALLISFERNGRVAGRLGGEEFVIALPHMPPAALMQFADQIRATIAGTSTVDCCRVTVSIGAATGAKNLDFDTLYKVADVALYEAKNKGRDRVVLGPAVSLVPTPSTALAS
ncbi:MAG: diguanylate cyclase [Pseudomonadota bacterium]